MVAVNIHLQEVMRMHHQEAAEGWCILHVQQHRDGYTSQPRVNAVGLPSVITGLTWEMTQLAN